MIIEKTGFLNGKEIDYNDDTMFYVQTGKGKGSYKTKATYRGYLGPAVFYYNGINLGNGFKKRLLMDGKVLTRTINPSGV